MRRKKIMNEIYRFLYFLYEPIYFLLKRLKINKKYLFIFKFDYINMSFIKSNYKDVKEFLSLIKPYNTNYELIRIGSKNDGGYLIPNDLEGIKYCFSPGVSIESSFEDDISKYGIKCFLADYSVDKPVVENNLFEFDKKFIGIKNNEVYITLNEWINSKKLDSTDFILQMDIEGAEYLVLNHIYLETLKKFRIIVIEFHNFEKIKSKYCLDLVKSVFNKLLINFEIVHLHPNNFSKLVKVNNFDIPEVIEFTFLRKDRINKKERNFKFPHDLDSLNNKNDVDIILPKCWFLDN